MKGAGWIDHAGKAVARLAERLGPRGQWPGWVVPDAAPGSRERDLAAPLTALGVLALLGLDVPGVEEVIRRSREHIERTVRPGGVWRYYGNIPPDTDDTAMCALALGLDHPLVRGRTASALEATRLENGLFPTWFESGWNPVVDTVPNAHVVAVIGPGPATDVAVAWLLDVVENGREVACSAYYPDPLDLHVALTRAVAAGVEALRPALECAARRVLGRLQDEAMSPYRLAQAVVVAAAGSGPGSGGATEGARRLVEIARPDGTWPADTLFVCRDLDRTGLKHYQSEAVVTALCVRALSVAATAEGAPR